jgi:hypothetical protein
VTQNAQSPPSAHAAHDFQCKRVSGEITGIVIAIYYFFAPCEILCNG